MKTDCNKYEDCQIPIRLCDEYCDDYDNSINPLEEDENKGCAELHFKQDMGEI